jgi:hypothetical protein
MEPPLVFTSRPGALRVRVPRGAPNVSPAAAAIHIVSRSAISDLLAVAAGRGGPPRETPAISPAG